MLNFQKDREALDSFEDRYISAMRARMGLDLFLHAERTVVEELIQKEEKKTRDESERLNTVKQESEQRQSVADRVLAENQQRIAKYPTLPIHDEASDEIERLFGALGTIEREFWTDLEALFRRAYTSAMMSPRSRLEEQLRVLCETGPDGIPPRLSRYQALFGWFPRKYAEIDKEAKKCMLEAAFLLNNLMETFREIEKAEDLTLSERQKVENMKQYVTYVIEDFRLKDLTNLKRM